MGYSKEGYRHDPRNGLSTGFTTDASVYPSQLNASETTKYDTIVIGSGYAGLIAARDLFALGENPYLQLDGAWESWGC